jgi:hypothetical protein
MPFNLTEHDSSVLSKVSMAIRGPEPVSGFNGGGQGVLSDNVLIPFQFPPMIKSDSKSGVWIVENVTQWEPMVIFEGANAKHVTISTTYVVTNHTGNGATWNVSTIAGAIKDMRSVFYSPMTDKMPVFSVQFYEHVPIDGEFATFRAISISESPGDSLITDKDGNIYAFRTDVTMELELVTKGFKDSSPQQQVSNLPDVPSQKWY